jgi:hypothetical protein
VKIILTPPTHFQRTVSPTFTRSSRMQVRLLVLDAGLTSVVQEVNTARSQSVNLLGHADLANSLCQEEEPNQAYHVLDFGRTWGYASPYILSIPRCFPPSSNGRSWMEAYTDDLTCYFLLVVTSDFLPQKQARLL